MVKRCASINFAETVLATIGLRWPQVMLHAIHFLDQKSLLSIFIFQPISDRQKIWFFFENKQNWIFKKILFNDYLDSFQMLILSVNAKTVALLTQPKHKIACSTKCGRLRPIAVNTVSTKSMIAHLLSILNHGLK
jgi:hypothetical protein